MAPAAGRGAAERRAAIAAARELRRGLLPARPGTLPAIHFMDARRPDECTRPCLANTFSSMIFWMRLPGPRLRGVAEGRGTWRRPTPTTRAQLRHVLWRIPRATSWFSSCPFHVWSLDALLTAYPDARLVWLHRKPRRGGAVHLQPLRPGQGARAATGSIRWRSGGSGLGEVARVLDDLDGVRRPAPARETPVLDVTYGELMRDPIAPPRAGYASSSACR